MITERDIDWLRFMGRFPMVTAQHLIVYSGTSKVIVSRRLTELVKVGCVEVAPVTLARRRLYSVTTDGRQRIGLPGKHRGIKLGEAEHDSLVVWWFMNETARFPDDEFHTDREIRALDWDTDGGRIAPMFAVERHGSRKGLMFPDFVRVIGDKFLAYELEFSPKYLRRTVENMEAYAAAPNVAGVMYACPDRLLSVVKKAAQQVNKSRALAGLGQKIYVSRVKDGGENGFAAETVL